MQHLPQASQSPERISPRQTPPPQPPKLAERPPFTCLLHSCVVRHNTSGLLSACYLLIARGFRDDETVKVPRASGLMWQPAKVTAVHCTQTSGCTHPPTMRVAVEKLR